jgi:hypothetical protein
VSYSGASSLTAMPIARIRLVASSVLIVTAAVVCGWTAWNWKLLRPYDWQQVESPDATFSVSFPGNPKASTQTERDAIDGHQFVSNRLTFLPAPQISYTVDWWENPEQKDKPTDELFAHFRDCDAKVFKGKIATQEFTAVGHPAIDIITVNVEGTVAHNRIIRVGSRIYSLWVIDASGRFAVDKKNISKFFASFSPH